MNEDDYLAIRQLPNGRTVYVLPLLFGRAKLCLDSVMFPGALFDDEW